MNRLILTSGIFVAATTFALADNPADDRALLSQAAANRTAPAAAKSDAGRAAPAVDAEEARAHAELTIAQARVDLIAARKALRDQHLQDAANRAQQIVDQLKSLPTGFDASELELQAEGILAKTQKAGVTLKAEPVLAAQPASASANVSLDSADEQARNAARIARTYEGAPTADIDAGGDANALRERALRNQTSDRFGYRPAREIVNAGNARERSRENLAYHPVLGEVYAGDEQRRLIQADEARVAGDGAVMYPADWAARSAARAKYAGKPLARSEAHNDKDGRQWYAAVYDIDDLTEIAPNFHPAFSLDPTETLYNAADREALRLRSQIFSGTAQDLAAGIPLLDYFGGNGAFDMMPHHSEARQTQVVEMIKAFNANDTEPRVIVLPQAK